MHNISIGGSAGRYPWYGVRIDDSNLSPDVERIASSTGAMDLHAELPVQAAMKGCLLSDAGTVNAYLPDTNWSDADTNGDGGQVIVAGKQFYRKVNVISPTVADIMWSEHALPGFLRVEPIMLGAYEAALNRSNLKLASVKNITATYRGGNNNAAWDAAANSLLGKPATTISLTNFRTYARNRGSVKWNVETLRLGMLLYEMFMIEYATKNSQKAVNATLTSKGYKQGGLGNGVTTAVSTDWNTFSTYHPFINCGASNSIGNGSGEVSVIVNNFGGAGVNRTFTVPRYLGIENPFGHIWKWQDGASVYHGTVGGKSKLYICDNPSNFIDATETNYSYRGDLPTVEGYVSKMLFDDKAVMFPKTAAGGSNTYYCDYFSTPGLVNGWRALYRGGHASLGANAGFGYLYSSYAASIAYANIGARLAYIP